MGVLSKHAELRWFIQNCGARSEPKGLIRHQILSDNLSLMGLAR
jgi:hypothetical protein